MLFLSKKDVIASGVTDMSAACEIIRRTLRLTADGGVRSAQEVPLKLDGEVSDEAFYSLPAYVGGEFNKAGIKWTTHHPHNKEKGLPHIFTTLELNDPATGVPLALMEGSVISAMRTGAVSAAAFTYLTNGEEKTLFCGGAGVQAEQQLNAALYAIPSLQTVHIFSKTGVRAKALAGILSAKYPEKDISAVDSPSAAGISYDVLIGATNTAEPYLHAEDFKDGCLYCHIGFKDIDEQAVCGFDSYVLDDFEAGTSYSGQPLFCADRKGRFDRSKIFGLLNEFETGKKSLSRSPGKKIMFDGFGMVIFDIALGCYVYEYAQKHGLGTEIDILSDK